MTKEGSDQRLNLTLLITNNTTREELEHCCDGNVLSCDGCIVITLYMTHRWILFEQPH